MSQAKKLFLNGFRKWSVSELEFLWLSSSLLSFGKLITQNLNCTIFDCYLPY